MPYHFFTSSGEIVDGWVMINGYDIFSAYQITNTTPFLQKARGDSFHFIDKTCLVVAPPIMRTFVDGNSPEDIEYRSTFSRWAWQLQETISEFEALGIEVVYLETPMVVFEIEDNQQIAVNTHDMQNGQYFSLYLYRAGTIPIFVYTTLLDNDVDIIFDYLGDDIPEIPDISGKYVLTTSDGLGISLDVVRDGRYYFYSLMIGSQGSSGQLLIRYNGGNILARIHDISWYKNLGALTEEDAPELMESRFTTFGIDMHWRDGAFTFVNMGNPDSYFQILQTNEKYITLTRQE
jgi:hypothetical protein